MNLQEESECKKMKICKHCSAAQEDAANFCSICGAELVEETAAEQTADETAVEETAAEETAVEETAAEAPVEEAAVPAEEPVTAQKKKTPVGLIVGLVAAILVVVAIIVVKGRHDQAAAQQEPQAPAAQETVTQTPTETPAETPAEGEIVPGEAHHTNAYGLPSYSVHFEAAEDGTVAYSYLNEAGETVTVTQEEVDALLDRVVASCGDIQLTNRELQYYYDQQVYSFYSMYSNYLSYFLDTTKSLDEQLDMYGSGTWQQSFIAGAMDMFTQIAALAQEAEAKGFTLDEEEQAYLDSSSDIEALAANYGYEDVALFVRDYIGPGATAESYKAFMQLSMMANCYASELNDAITVTAEEAAAYYEANAEMMQSSYGIQKVDKPVVNVRHILIQPTAAEDGTISDAAWAAAESQAQSIYDEWMAGAATEESFAELATANTQDPGSQTTGGLYEEVYPGQMVPEFEDWCFADGRQVGDHGMVKTSYGYHIMFFSGEGDYIYWQMVAEDMCRQEKAAAEREAIAATYTADSDLSGIIILDATAPTIPVVEEESAAE